MSAAHSRRTGQARQTASRGRLAPGLASTPASTATIPPPRTRLGVSTRPRRPSTGIIASGEDQVAIVIWSSWRRDNLGRLRDRCPKWGSRVVTARVPVNGTLRRSSALDGVRFAVKLLNVLHVAPGAANTGRPVRESACDRRGRTRRRSPRSVRAVRRRTLRSVVASGPTERVVATDPRHRVTRTRPAMDRRGASEAPTRGDRGGGEVPGNDLGATKGRGMGPSCGRSTSTSVMCAERA